MADKKLILNNAAEKIRNVSGDFGDIFSEISSILPDKVTPSDLTLAFRIACFQESSKHEFIYCAEIPAIISRGIQDMSDEFFWQFRCEFGYALFGILPPRENSGGHDCKILDDNPEFADISKKDPAEVLSALYNYAWPFGMGFNKYLGTPMTPDAARLGLAREKSKFDYVAGRAMYINFASEMLHIGAYNNCNGRGIAERAIRTCKDICR